MPTPRLTNEIITAAIQGFEFQKTSIDGKIAQLRALLPGGSTQTAATPEAPTGKRKVSAAARRRMALGQKARWAKLKGESKSPAPTAPEPEKPKRNLSAAAKAKLVANLKKARAAKAAKARAIAKKVAPARKKTTAKKAAAKTAPAKAAKKTAVKKAAATKAAAKKTAPAAAQTAETADQ
jgi:hypothetical protein